MAKKNVEQISVSDERLLQGFKDVVYEEPEQIIPVDVDQASKISKEEQNTIDLNKIRDDAGKILNKIETLRNEIDAKCKDLSVTVVEGEESDNELLKAMWRVFKQRTTTISYQHYKKALELREQLAREDEGKIKLS